MISNCPSCGFAINPNHIIGRYLCCPACRNEFILHGDLTTELSVKYYPSGQSWEAAIEQIFVSIIANADKQTAQAIKLIEHKEIALPFVNVVDSRKNESLACIAKQNPINLESIFDIKQFKHINPSDAPSIISCEKLPFDTDKLISFDNNYSYVSSEIKYIPIKYLIVEINGNRHTFVSYGEHSMPLDGDGGINSNIINPQPKTNTKWYNLFRQLFAILVIIAAWYYFCYTYYHFHGIIDLIVYAEGLKYFLPFLGVCLGVSFFNSTLKDYISTLLQSHNENAWLRLKDETKQIIISKLNL